MVYAFLKILMRITVRIFFRSITVRNKSLMSLKGPLVVVANHPGTFLDPILIATLLNRKVYFLAKGELFKGKFISWILSGLNMIPVYRKQDDPSQMSKNEDTFLKCYEHLERGGVILIFPEGTSITERKLRPVKTGAARIALGAEARNEFALGVQVLTIGLNYVNPHKFNRDVFVNLEEPIRVGDFKSLHEENGSKASQELTETIRVQLERLIIAVNDAHSDELVKNVELLYKSKRLKELGFSEKDKEADFELTKKIVEVIQYYLENEPERSESMRNRIQDYLRRLDQLGLDDEVIGKKQSGKSFVESSIRHYLIVVLGFPLYVYGLLWNYLPFEIPAWIARKVTRSIEYRGPIGMVLGIFTFSIFYSVEVYWFWKFTQQLWFTLLFALSLPVSGFFTYWYYHTLGDIRAKWMFMMLFYRKNTLIAALIQQRKELLQEFVKVREEYGSR